MEHIANHAEDPIDVLLALEMDAFWGSTERLSIYDRLAAILDDDLVARRITHERNNYAGYLESQGVIKSLTGGRKAPEFAITNLEGLNITLHSLIAENQLVLIDFWASWCAPCIASFPELKKSIQHTKTRGLKSLLFPSIPNTKDGNRLRLNTNLRGLISVTKKGLKETSPNLTASVPFQRDF